MRLRKKMPMRQFETLVSPKPPYPFIEDHSGPSSEEAEQDVAPLKICFPIVAAAVRLCVSNVPDLRARAVGPLPPTSCRSAAAPRGSGRKKARR
jgi:hypothetical protein